MTSNPPTYVVRLTPPGRGAVASLLVCGPQALAAVDAHLHLAGNRTLASAPMHAIRYGRWQEPRTGEEVVVSRRAGDRIEVHCHGGAAASEAIVESLCRQGCRELGWQDWLAASAEDPLAAAAAIALTHAPTDRAAAILAAQWRGGALRREIDQLRDALANRRAGEAAGIVGRLLELAPVGRHLVEPWRVVLAGRPNVGKSSLINALVGYQRAIVHPTPGTTRDAVAADCALDGWPVELTDTAGLRAGADAIESAGIELARARLAEADLAVMVFDASGGWSDEDEQFVGRWPSALRVFNKCDLAPGAAGEHARAGDVRASAATGEGLELLAREIATRLVPKAPAEGEAVPFDAEHVQALVLVDQQLRAGDVDAAAGVLSEPPFGGGERC